MVRLPLAIALALTVLTSGVASAARAPTVDRSPLLWATVNTCDTTRSPDTIGIRASMPGSGKRAERMFMRFQVQFRSPADGLWHRITNGADSGFVAVGSARFVSREAGRSFRFAAPDAGSTLVLRGKVTYEWRTGKRVVRRAVKSTSAGYLSAVGSDPRGFSAAVCEVT